MKLNIKIIYLILPVLIACWISSCKKDENVSKGAPTIERVRLLSKTDTIRDVIHPITLDSNSIYDQTRLNSFDSTVVSGRLNTQYAILGSNLLTTKLVSFNGVSVYFNPGLITDNSIILTLPATLPFGPTQSNKLIIETQYGSIDFNFSIQQPPPIIASFTPLAAGAGDVVTITGSVFNSVTAVRFDTTPAEIIGTPTNQQIQVRVPAGVVQSYIYVTTPGGTTRSAGSFGFKSLVYDDAFTAGWGSYFGYNSTRDLANTEHPKRGNVAIKTTFSDAYGAFQVGYNGATLDVKKAGLTSIKFSVYGGASTTGKSVQVVINGSYGSAVVVPLTSGSYTDYTIPLKSLGDPATISEIVIQSAGGNVPSTIYIDDIGFI
ncbi:IPT/TIG domain-containing protein [Arcticibacter eurypsychrophilus]|uniref:IPT/TIG domain-containing protein n=1 Tax=Arcticibacter eurypsychrophilus TaxID=1434752 RepID=UPI00084DCE0C|nr:IPT/TIG domain-containing protein [Arcticibacter eurypsychrophilus]